MLPKKWRINCTKENYNILKDWREAGTYGYRDEGFLLSHYNGVIGYRIITSDSLYSRLIEEFELITDAQFTVEVLKKWSIKLTAENLNVLNGWRTDSGLLTEKMIGHYLHTPMMNRQGYNAGETRDENYPEISTSDFYAFVLNEVEPKVPEIKIPERWYVHVVEIGDDKLVYEYINKTYDSNISGLWTDGGWYYSNEKFETSRRYTSDISNADKASRTEISVEFFKTQILKQPIKMGQTLKGYELIAPEYEKAAIKITGYDDRSNIKFTDFIKSSLEENFVDALTSAGVLNLWFKPIIQDHTFKIGDWVKIVDTGSTVGGKLTDTDKVHEGAGTGHIVQIEGITPRDGNATEKDPRYYGSNWNLRQCGFVLPDAEEVKETIIRELKRRYPIGTAFYPAHCGEPNGDYCIVVTDEIRLINDCYHSMLPNGRSYYDGDRNPEYGNCTLNRVLYSEGRWAKIVDIVPKTTIKGYQVNFNNDTNTLNFGCQGYSYDFVLQLDDMLSKNDFKFEHRQAVSEIASYLRGRKK